MFVKKIKSKNKTHLYLVESYRKDNKVKHRTIKSLGVLEELQKENPNVDIIKELSRKYNKEKETIQIDVDSSILERTSIKNYGYFLLEAIYEKLGISNFLNHWQSDKKIEYCLNNVMKLLVFSRILKPESKLRTLKNCDIYFDDLNVDINAVYRSLDLMDTIKEDLQLFIHKNIVSNYGRDNTVVFYDVTNYYFEIHENDPDKVNDSGEIIQGFRRKGFGKDGKKQPLVVMGLIMDINKIPISYQLFKGSEADTKTLIPIFEEMCKKYNLQKIILVADKGINSENNLNYLVTRGNGYILSQKSRGQRKELTDEILRQDNYISESEKFKYKSIIRKRKLKCNGDRSKDIIVDEKIVFFWSKSLYDRAQHKRKEELEKIQHFLKNQKVLVKIEKDLKPYITEIIKDSAGEQVPNGQVDYVFNEEKFNESRQLDGYYLIITNQTAMSEKEIIEKYRGLSEIENSFRILKSDFEGRPVYVRNKSRIEGHFLTCFLSLVIMRVLQQLTEQKYSVEALSTAINSATLKPFQKDLLLFNKTDDVYSHIEKMFRIKNDFSYLKYEQMKNYKKELFDYILNRSFP